MASSRMVAGLGVAVLAVVAGVALAAGRGADAPVEQAESTESAGSTTEEAPPLLLPNLRSIAATELRVEGTGTGRLLRFSAALANLGPGPLLLRPRPPGDACPRGRLAASQAIFGDDADDDLFRPGRDRPAESRFAGCMLNHPGHDHWHFDAMASYVLRNVGNGQVAASQRKVSFCLRDNRRVRGVATRVRREHFGECTRTKHQGISPGWVDVYSWELDGQALPLPDVDGRRLFCLELAADPRNLLLETDETDNGTAIGVAVEGDTVTRRPHLDC